MLREILYHLRSQIETHMYNHAGRDDLRILMSERQLREMERLMWATSTAVIGRSDPYNHYGLTSPRGSEPASFQGVEIVPTVMDMEVPQVVRLASI
ncbi:hypothetical protein MHM88_14200 [Epibacterium sp. MM17-32]|uniref:hypothetical protein n=1 Tax=Epibacterium sp. MM17-32 TaxID=2917734 RepID=UPI001EF3F9EF|nr:hypothetical protein [Epibacterium sp. MM17-32]MCG7628959.1 hypothetical protein [Epibacterium sp. MM17-32]